MVVFTSKIQFMVDSIFKFLSCTEYFRTTKFDLFMFSFFSYLASGQLFLNGYLKSQGFPKSTFFDPKKPVDSISTFINYVANKYFDTKIQSREYVQPAVEYTQVRIRGAVRKFQILNWIHLFPLNISI